MGKEAGQQGVAGHIVDQGIGARLVRKEDDRYMRGRGQFVGDIKLPGMLEVAFLSSPLAHARIRSINIPPELRDRIFVATDLAGVLPIRADTTLPGFKSSTQPVLATGKVRHVGELVAMCIAPTRAEAEDLAAAIELDLEPLPVVADMLDGRKPGAPLVHEPWGDNLFLVSCGQRFEAAIAKAADLGHARAATSRQAMHPLEGNGVIAQWESRPASWSCTPSTQQPHMVRAGLSDVLGVDEAKSEWWRPTSAGGSATSASCCPEEVALAWVA